MRRCVFFDRDGVVNRTPAPARYVLNWRAFVLEPAFVEAAKVASGRGYALAVATNQRCLALGLAARSAIDDIHRRLAALLREAYGLNLLEVAMCPHDPDDGCSCRKPKPGMLKDLARRHNLNLARSWMVGDSESDVEAGRSAGCRTILVGEKQDTLAEHRVQNIADLPGRLRIVLDQGLFPAPGC